MKCVHDFKLDFRFSRLQTKIEKTNIVFDFRFESAKRKSKNEHRLRFSFFKMENENRKTNLGSKFDFQFLKHKTKIEL